MAHPEWAVAREPADAFERLVARREAGEPVAYLLGVREFYGRPFAVDARVLVPRPETELLVEIGVAAVHRFRERGVQPHVVDVGTGSGAIAVSLAAETGVPVVATDVSAHALALAAENARALGQEGRVTFLRTSLLEGLTEPIHVLLANLPYLPENRTLPRDVGDYEPRGALFGGTAGTELVERLLAEARRLIVPGGEMAFEIDEGQGARLAALAAGLYPSAKMDVLRDQAGLERVLQVCVPER